LLTDKHKDIFVNSNSNNNWATEKMALDEEVLEVPLKMTAPGQGDGDSKDQRGEPPPQMREDKVTKTPTAMVMTTTITTKVDLESIIARARLMAKAQLVFEIVFLAIFRTVGVDAVYGLLGACMPIVFATRFTFTL